jgi:hypothetical protein
VTHPDYQEDFEKLEQQLVKLYGLCQMGNIKWFLGICIERLFISCQIYLVQDSFITKVCTEFSLIHADNKYPSTLSPIFYGSYPMMDYLSHQIQRPINTS